MVGIIAQFSLKKDLTPICALVLLDPGCERGDSGVLPPGFSKCEKVHPALFAYSGMVAFQGRIFTLLILGCWPLAHNQ